MNKFKVGDIVKCKDGCDYPHFGVVKDTRDGTFYLMTEIGSQEEWGIDEDHIELTEAQCVYTAKIISAETPDTPHVVLYTEDGNLKLKEFTSEEELQKFVGSFTLAHLDNKDDNVIEAVIEGRIKTTTLPKG